MADIDSTIDSELIELYDLWPGAPNPAYGIPADGFTAASHHNVASPAYPLGTKIQVENTGAVAGVRGVAVFAYLKLGAQDATNVLAPKHLCVHHSGAVPYVVTNEVATILGADPERSGPVAVALSAMTTGRYGWFWVGGVCPEEFVAALGGNYPTDASVAIGDMKATALVAPGTTPGEIGFGLPAADTSTVVGCALAADAADDS